MQTTHTPGPWHVEQHNANFAYVEDAQGLEVAKVMGDDAENLRLNGLLVAAAPDLLAALELIGNEPNYNCNCVEQHSWYGGGHCTACPVAIAQDAISKAKGA